MRYPWYSRSCHSTLGEHPYPTHSLPESVDMLVCLGCIISIPITHICTYVCILWYDVYNAAARLHRILILLSSHSVCTYVHPYLAPRIRAFPSLCMCTTHTYTHTYVCASVYYTVHAPYHIHGTLPPLTRLHVRSKPHIPIHLSIDRYTISYGVQIHRYLDTIRAFSADAE